MKNRARNFIWIGWFVIAFCTAIVLTAFSAFLAVSARHGSSPIPAAVKAANSPTLLAKEPVHLSADEKLHMYGQPKLPTTRMRVGKTVITAEIARTDEEREHGLSWRPPLANNEGMLFIFPEASPQMFWMFGMRFSLDFIWLRNNTIVKIHENVPPPSLTNGEPRTVSPGVDVDMVLEVNSGFIKRNKIKVGDTVEFLKK